MAFGQMVGYKAAIFGTQTLLFTPELNLGTIFKTLNPTIGVQNSMKRISLIAILIISIFSLAHSQDQKLNATSIKLGFALNTQAGYHVNFGFERKIHSRISLQLNLGFFPFYIPKSDTFSSLNYHLSIEGRYFFKKAEKEIQNGFYFGPFLALDRDIGYFKGTLQPAFRQYWKTAGITIGYQRVFSERLCVSTSLQPTYTNLVTADGFYPNGNPQYRFFWHRNVIIYARIEFGYNF
jgi:hypothetical protein